MKGSVKIFTLIIFHLFSIAVAFTACSAPVGSLLADSGSDPSIKVVLRPRVFHINTVFMPENVQVWKTGSSGRELVTDTDNIKISIRDGELEVENEVPQVMLVLKDLKLFL